MTEVEYTDEFGNWWDGLTESEQESVGYAVGLLEGEGADARLSLQFRR